VELDNMTLIERLDGFKIEKQNQEDYMLTLIVKSGQHVVIADTAMLRRLSSTIRNRLRDEADKQ